jgi:hypothetical protein
MRYPLLRWLGIALLSLTLWNSPASGEAPAGWGLSLDASAQQQQDALSTLASLSSLRGSRLDESLARLGFVSTLAQADWQALPEKAKLDMAYRWAAAVSPDNGHLFIASLARDFAKRYESLEFDPMFRHYFKPSQGSDAPVQFRRPATGQVDAALDDEVARTLNRLATYVGGADGIGRYSVATAYFGLSGAELEDALSRRDPRDFLRFAAQRAPVPPKVTARINSLMAAVVARSEAAGADASLGSIHDTIVRRFGRPAGSDRPTAAFFIGGDDQFDHPPAPGDGGGGGGGGGGGSPERAARAASLRQGFDARFYPHESGRSFMRVSGRMGGEGGVIAGAEVTSSLSRPVSVTLRARADVKCDDRKVAPLLVNIVVRTQDSEYVYPDVPCDVALAARKLVYESNGVHAWVLGEAIGLASIDTADLTKTFPLFIPASNEGGYIAHRHGMILHPALVDSTVGRTVSLMDLWPSAPTLLLQRTNQDAHVGEWLRDMGSSVTWKWTDSPARIDATGSSLTVTPRNRKNLISLHAFSRLDQILETIATAGGEDKKVGRNIETLDAASPALIANLPEFDRVERLYRTLAIYRWARTYGASASDGDVQFAKERIRTPDTVLVGVLGTYVAEGPAAGNWQAECITFYARLNRAAAAAIAAPDSRTNDRRRLAMEGVMHKDLATIATMPATDCAKPQG